MNAPPETLADVKVGDEVTIFIRDTYEPRIVKRVTKTLVVLEDDSKFIRSSRFPHEVGTRRANYRSSWHIDVGQSAAERVKKIDGDHARMVASNEWFRAARLGFSADGVRDVRAACDRAEAALRELGEWTNS